MNIELRFFASVREKLGTSSEKLSLPPEVQTVGQVRAYLRQRGGAWADALAADRALRMAYNHEMTDDAETPITEGCEVAFFPPVTGG